MLSKKHKRLITTNSLFIVFSFAITACDNDSNSSSVDPIEGTWLREGYHQYIQIDDKTVSIFDYTPNKSAVDHDWCFLTEQFELDTFNETVNPQISTDKSKLAFDALELLLDDGGARSYDRIDAMPTVCANGGMLTNEDIGFEGDALDDYKLFWHAFNVHYPFFELRNIGWSERYNAGLSLITEHTTPTELLEIITNSLADISDGHVSTSLDDEYPDIPGSGEEFLALFLNQFNSTGEQGDIEDYIDIRFSHFITTLREQYLDLSGELEIAGGNIIWGTLTRSGNPQIGFIRLDSFLPEGDEDNFFDQYTEFLDTIDQIMFELRNTESMIIDVRLNGGGAETIAFHFANHFTDEERLVFSKQVYTEEGSSPIVPYSLTPQDDQAAYLKPVRVLVGSYSVSAAETFPMMMRALPNVQLVGTRTSGTIATAIDKSLPYSGIVLEIPAEIYTTFDDKIFEEVGVEVDIEVEEFSLQDFDESKDSMLDIAILSLIEDQASMSQ